MKCFVCQGPDTKALAINKQDLALCTRHSHLAPIITRAFILGFAEAKGQIHFPQFETSVDSVIPTSLQN